jgi:hypothetical protein
LPVASSEPDFAYDSREVCLVEAQGARADSS